MPISSGGRNFLTATEDQRVRKRMRTPNIWKVGRKPTAKR